MMRAGQSIWVAIIMAKRKALQVKWKRLAKRLRSLGERIYAAERHDDKSVVDELLKEELKVEKELLSVEEAL